MASTLGVGSVTREHPRLESETFEGRDRIALDIRDQHRGQVFQAVFACDVDELIDERGPEARSSEIGIDHPLDPPAKTERASISAVKRCIGHDPGPVECEERKCLRIVEIVYPLSDRRALPDVRPGEPSRLGRNPLKKVMKRVHIVLTKRSYEDPSPIAKIGFDGISLRHLNLLSEHKVQWCRVAVVSAQNYQIRGRDASGTPTWLSQGTSVAQRECVIEKVNCESCNRSIAAEVRQCPYCNLHRDPRNLVGERREDTIVSTITAPRPQRKPRTSDREWVRKLVLALLALGLIVGVFFIGVFVRSLGVDVPDVKEETPVEGPTVASAAPRSDLNLISDPAAAGIGRSYTSRSAIDVDLTQPDEFQRRDATALPESVYRNVAQQEQQREAEKFESVDPRNVTDAVRPRQRRPEPPPTESTDEARPASEATSTDTSVRTNPRPLSQPVPPIRTREKGAVRLQLTISPSGTVTDVRVLEGLTGVTQTIADAARNWTFSPATENGRPVEGTYQVAIKVNQ